MPPFCDRCGDWHSKFGHKCNPKWRVWHPDGGEDEDTGRDFTAFDPEEAAEKWARKWNQDDYPLMNGSTEIVHVRDHQDDNKVKRFRVSAEPDIIYNATELDDD